MPGVMVHQGNIKAHVYQGLSKAKHLTKDLAFMFHWILS